MNEPTLSRAPGRAQGMDTLQSSAAWRAAREAFFATADPAPTLATLGAATDAIVRDAFAAAMGGDAAPATLLAVGSYARGVAFPYSSADLLLVCRDDAELGALNPLLTPFMQRLWDRGLQLNCATRTLASVLDVRLAHSDARTPQLDVLVSLLDRRLLGGDPRCLEKIERELPAVLASHAGRLRQELARAAGARHVRFQNSPHLLVPDVKKGPGGLMDLRLLRLFNQLGLDRDPGADLEPAARFLAMVRCYLHFESGRNQNRLEPALRPGLARPPFAVATDPVEWMRGYYRMARQVLAALSPALAAAQPTTQISALDAYHDRRGHLSNTEFTVARDQLLLRHPAQLATDPERLLRLLSFVARHGVVLAPDTAWRLAAAAPALASHLAPPGARWEAVRTLLPLPHLDRALRALEAAGLLPLLLPGWEAIEGLAVDSPGRHFTADEHTLRCLEALAALRGPVTAASDPLRHRFTLLLGDCDHPAEMVLALLLHALPPPQAVRALDVLAPPAEARARIELLLERRQPFAAAITARDLGDPEAARALAAVAGTIEQLKSLVLLAYAELAATSLESLASWRLEQLWLAYGVTRDELTRGLESDRILEVPAELPGRPEFIRGFPARYLRAHTRAELEMHAALDAASHSTGAAVRLDPTLAGFRIAVIAPDRPGLFAAFAGALASFGMNILKAEAFANASGVILDTFLFADPNRMLQHNPSEGERLTDMFRRVALGKTDARRLMRSAPQLAPSSLRRAHASVRFVDDPAGASTLIEVQADDRPGLLFSLANVLAESGCDIHVVLIDTQGHRAQDVFYAARAGRPLPPELQSELAEKLCGAC